MEAVVPAAELGPLVAYVEGNAANGALVHEQSIISQLILVLFAEFDHTGKVVQFVLIIAVKYVGRLEVAGQCSLVAQMLLVECVVADALDQALEVVLGL